MSSLGPSGVPPATTLPPVTTGMVVVFAIAVGAFVLFASETVRVDVTALAVMVALMVLEPWTQIAPSEGVSGFSNEATIVILAMFILSGGIRRSGVVQRLSVWMLSVAGADEFRQLLVTVGIGGVPSGFINNTPVVAMLIPAVSELARRSGTSPSKLLIPLSYASILGGTLTLVGTTSNLLASDLSRRLLDHRITMFEFTHLGIVVFLTGVLYLLVVGRYLLPERTDPDGALLREYQLETYLTAVVVDEGSPLVGRSIEALHDHITPGLDILQVIRGGEQYVDPYSIDPIEAGDAFVVQADLEALRSLISADGLSFASASEISLTEPDDAPEAGATGERFSLVEVVLPSTSAYVDSVIGETPLRDRYDATVLAIRRRGELVHHRIDELQLRGGDALLLQITDPVLDRLAADPDFITVRELPDPDYRTEKAPLAVGIVVCVVVLAALGVLDLRVAALGGVVAMVLSGVLQPEELYEAVHWDVIFLLAGIIPLGLAVERTGGADLIGALVAATAEFLPPIAVLWVFYIVTVLLTALVSNTASVVLAVPIAVETAGRIGADPLVFVLAVMFASSADFMTPIGYQTNLLVYGPGGYRFTDYTRIGAPLELLLSVVTVGGLAVFWGL